VTTPGQVSGATQQAAGVTASSAKDEAAQVGQTAKSAVSDVAGTATEQAGQVVTEAVDQVKQLTQQARTQAGEQAGNATQKLSESLRSLANEVRELSQGKADGSGTAAGLAQQLADKGDQVAQYLASQGPDGLLQDVRGFAARKPGSFLLAALTAGLATGRVVKGASAAASSTAAGGSAAGTASAPVAVVQPVVEVPPVETYAATSEPYGSQPYVGGTADPYPATTPVAHSDDSGILDSGTTSIGPVSGDERSSVPPYESGSGLR
jgi:hypothetical protein